MSARVVSNLPIERFYKCCIPVTETGCWLWLLASDKDGYGKVQINKKHIRAHRWSWILHFGEIPANLQVLHRCDVPACVNPDHLFLGTNQDNNADKIQKGREYKLPLYRHPKITEEDVSEIRRLRGIVRIVDLASRFGLHHSQISRIQNNKYWKHLKEVPYV